MKKTVALVLIMVISTTVLSAQRITARFHADLALGDDENKPREYLFAFPKFISTDSKENIYIADARSSSVRVFSSDGQFVKSIGSRGQGPGEFLDVTSMVVDSRDDLIVIDHFNMRITRFSDMGAKFETYRIPVNGRAQPWHVRTLGADAYVLYYQVYNAESYLGQGKLLHVVSHDFQTVQESFAEKSDIWDLTKKFEKARAGGPYSASITTSGDSLIIIVPTEYKGFVYFYRGRDHRSKLSIHKGHHPDMEPYKLLDQQQDTDPKLQPLGGLNAPLGNFVFLKNNIGLGIHVMNDGTIVNFSFLRDNKGKYVFGVEFFDVSGRFLGYSPIKNYKPFPGDELPGFNVLWKDSKDRFYLIDRTDFPTIRRMSLEYEIKDE